MKRLFFLLIVAVACVLPQFTWAADPTTNEASLDETTGVLTITSTKAGNLHAGSVEGFSSLTAAKKAAVTKIVLWGYFNADDLEDLRGRVVVVESENIGIFLNVTEVDMTEAYFTRDKNTTPPSTYMWFSGTPTGSAGTEARAWSGGSLYQLHYPRVWNSYSGTPTSNVTSYANATAMNNDKENGEVGRFAKTNKYVWRQMSETNDSWTQLTEWDGDGSTGDGHKYYKRPDGYIYTVTWYDNELTSHYSDYQNNDIIEVYEYWQVTGSTGNWTWTKVYPAASEIAAARDNNKLHVGEWVGANYSSLQTPDNNSYVKANDYIRFSTYYRKGDTRSWSDPATETDPGSATNADFDDSERNNYMRGYGNGAWVRMVTYSYYQLAANTSASASERTWKPVTGKTKVDVVKYHFDDINGEAAIGAKSSGNDGDYAVVGGTEYVYTGSAWETYDSWSSTTFVFDYSAMKFDYWSSSLTTAKTSRHANESISDAIFSNCKSLTHVDYLGGNVTGFGDHKSTEGYADNLTITIGKDVTKISNAAFRRCDVLKTVNWGPYAAGDAQSMVYPKELVIENEAFLHAKNLMSITIPNRVTYIGDNAFEQVGTGAAPNVDYVKEHPDAYNYTFTLTFERRNANDTDQGPVAISCDKPLTIGNDAFLNCWFLKKLSLPIRLEEMGEGCFANTINLEELEMREETKAAYTPPTGHDLLRTIPNRAFYDSGIKNLTIPKCVTKIEKHAFADTEYLEKITFQGNLAGENYPLIIESGAFTEGREEGRPQLDVYVMVNPNQRKIICEYQAFNFTQTVGQTSTSTTTPSFAYLHFPEEYWDYYQGNWKRGLAFRQGNLNDFKDGYTGDFGGDSSLGKCVGKGTAPINTSDGKYHKEGADVKFVAPANGWQEFARTSTNIDIEIPNTGSFMRTYSTPKPMSVPVYAKDDTQQQVHAGDPFFKVYRISHFDDGYTNGDDVATSGHSSTAKALEVKEHMSGRSDYSDVYIPSNTGLLMAGTGTGSVSYILYMKEVTVASEQTYAWTETQGTVAEPGNTNLLWPSCVEDDKTTTKTVNGVEYVVLNPSYPHPYQKGGHPDLRFFGLAVKTVSDVKTYYFSRFKEGGVVTHDKAYLRLPYALFHWQDEGQEATGNSGITDPEASSARVALQFIDDDGETTSIRVVDLNTMQIINDTYYTLQGVKVNGYPTKSGIYIHNGRKVVIK